MAILHSFAGLLFHVAKWQLGGALDRASPSAVTAYPHRLGLWLWVAGRSDALASSAERRAPPPAESRLFPSVTCR